MEKIKIKQYCSFRAPQHPTKEMIKINAPMTIRKVGIEKKFETKKISYSSKTAATPTPTAIKMIPVICGRHNENVSLGFLKYEANILKSMYDKKNVFLKAHLGIRTELASTLLQSVN